eukprot:Skav200335  [mRNA]  locus=scaffold26:26161:26394:+ [translate_table: standard]
MFRCQFGSFTCQKYCTLALPTSDAKYPPKTTEDIRQKKYQQIILHSRAEQHQRGVKPMGSNQLSIDVSSKRSVRRLA